MSECDASRETRAEMLARLARWRADPRRAELAQRLEEFWRADALALLGA